MVIEFDHPADTSKHSPTGLRGRTPYEPRRTGDILRILNTSPMTPNANFEVSVKSPTEIPTKYATEISIKPKFK